MEPKPEYVPAIPPADITTYYINQLQLAAGVSDFSLLCGIQAPIKGAPNIPLLNIILSPTNAKTLGLMLLSAVNAYEGEFKTKIPTPPQFVEAEQKMD